MPAGLPLASELWQEIRRRASSLSDRAEHFRYDLQTFIDYKRRCDRQPLEADAMDFDSSLKFLLPVMTTASPHHS
jgi:hypothetical protein